jgi:hypothetical protein
MRRAFLVLATFAILLFAAAPVSATHSHVRVLGDGTCVILAASGHEDGVVLPDSVFANNPNVDPAVSYPDGRRHPLHVLVHIAANGSGHLLVLGSPADLAACDRYVND